MLTLIFVCLILCFIGFILNKEITWYEFVGNCLISIICSLILFGICILPIPNDFYYQSGRLNVTEYHPEFVEEYEQRHEEQYACGKDDEGNTEYCTRIYYTTEHAKHHAYYLTRETKMVRKEKFNKYKSGYIC